MQNLPVRLLERRDRGDADVSRSHNDDIDLTVEDRTYRLAERLLEFEHLAINNWCSYDDVDDPGDQHDEELPPIIDELFEAVRTRIN